MAFWSCSMCCVYQSLYPPHQYPCHPHALSRPALVVTTITCQTIPLPPLTSAGLHEHHVFALPYLTLGTRLKTALLDWFPISYSLIWTMYYTYVPISLFRSCWYFLFLFLFLFHTPYSSRAFILLTELSYCHHPASNLKAVIKLPYSQNDIAVTVLSFCLHK